MENLVRLTALQILIPTVSTGLLAGGTLLFVFIFALYKEKKYLAITLLGLIGMIFVGSEAATLFIGGQYRNIELARQFQRIEQIAAAFFLFILPYLGGSLFNLTPKEEKLNKILTYTGLGLAIFFTIIAFAFPDLYISFTRHHPKWQINEADYGRGDIGILYLVRDGFLGIFIIYFLTMIIRNLIKYKNFKLLLLPLIGILVGIYSAVVDMLYPYTGINYDLFPKEIFSRFSFGITFFIATCMIGLTRKFIESAKELEDTYRKLEISEKKYRLLVEGTQDWIFSMDENFMIKTGNNSFLKDNGIKESNLGKIHFLELVFFPEEASIIGIQVIKNEISKLLKDGSPISFKCFFKGLTQLEPKEYNVKMENISVEGKKEILCKVTKIEEDPLLKYFHSEKKKYILPNNILVAKEMSKQMVKNLTKYIDKSEVQLLEMAIFEMIINSIEHGNLKINFEEKSIALQKGEYLNFLMERQNLPEYKNKKVTIEYTITPEHAAFKISDDGEGFDHKKLIGKSVDEVNDQMIAHGRGISLTQSLFDEIKYNETGNQVLLVKRIKN